MRNAIPSRLLTGLLVLAAAGCSGGSNESTANVAIRCNGGRAFCLISCDLGCTQSGCSVSEIAENQRLRFVFNDRIAPGSVNSSSVSIRTPSGVAPDGDLLVSDRELSFVPRVTTVGGVSTFGFRRNETYIVTLARAVAGQGVRSLSGDGLDQELSCTVIASRGIQDEDQQAPTVTLVSPTTPTGLPLSPTIVLRFSELIDTTPLQGVLGASSPVTFTVRNTVNSGGTLVCDTDVAGVAIEGLPTLSTERVGASDVTVVTFQPPLPLPSSACLTVTVTADLRDLSGRPAIPASFELFTAVQAPQPITITEGFANADGQDVDQSSGLWANGARPGLIGGDGRHGSFDLSIATPTAVANEYEIDTGGTTIPASRTLSGVAEAVTDGRFFFSDFVVPANTTLRFKGTVPPQIFVRGKAEILGSIKISGADMPFWIPTSGPSSGQRVSDFNGRGTTLAGNIVAGQVGSAGGVGGGRGGNGGKECNGTTVVSGDIQEPAGSGIFICRGQPGQNVQLPGGHAFAAFATNTGGRGSLIQPLSALLVNYLTTQLLGSQYRAQFSPGGGGGGFAGPGGTAAVTPLGVTVIGVPQAGGVAFSLVPLPDPLPVGFTSLNHFMVGGSGGGGGGSHLFGTQQTATLDAYIAGAGGSGGGGTMAIRAGGLLTVASGSLLESRGGRGVLINADDKNTAALDANWGVTSPGGGGSGGSFLLQSGRQIIAGGTIDTTGGEGSRTGNVQLSATAVAPFNISAQAGAGSVGFYRLEAPSVTYTGVGIPAFNPAVHAGSLEDRDDVTASLSLWLTSGRLFPPTWLRYELDVDVDGDDIVDQTYTDSGVGGTQKANDPAGPVMISFQGAKLNQAGTAPEFGAAPKPWREGIGSAGGPGIALDSPTGFRFMLRFNRAVAPNCVVRALRVFAQS